MLLNKIQHKIYQIRDLNIMFDFDLAALYQVETRVLKQAVRRNIDRFPKDFMFQLTTIEINTMVSQNVIPSKSHLGGALPYAFTEQGVAMLSTVLRSKKAVQINISIMRAFVHLRKYAFNYVELAKELKHLEHITNKKFRDVFKVLDHLIKQKENLQPRKRIGFK